MQGLCASVLLRLSKNQLQGTSGIVCEVEKVRRNMLVLEVHRIPNARECLQEVRLLATNAFLVEAQEPTLVTLHASPQDAYISGQ